MTLSIFAALQDPTVTLEMVLWSVYIGFVLAMCGVVYSKNTPGKLIGALEKKEAFSPDKAVTLKELGFEPTWRVKRALRHGSVERKYVSAVNEESSKINCEYSKFRLTIMKLLSIERKEQYEYSFDTQKWYIPEERRYAASVRYEHRGCNIPMIVVSSIMLLAAVLALCWTAPHLIEWFTSAIGI